MKKLHGILTISLTALVLGLGAVVVSSFDNNHQQTKEAKADLPTYQVYIDRLILLGLFYIYLSTQNT